ncbi:hypothetical protein GCM10009557_50380 [Virgisporangium ochraceum]|uniref:Uncharacterized protein n=1 Tax=Virgisporangium ochraceum TaxID=65505 RepID=A0A8J4EIA1_9ACTN|nr:hypothetical protein [Virgisporangium ochraceum]GIJ75506.1 hypothetical protein Voc01_104230 [Virgisporangium ochraceum]
MERRPGVTNTHASVWRRLAAVVVLVGGALLVPGTAAASGSTISGPGFLYTATLGVDPVSGAKRSVLPDWAVDDNCTVHPGAEVVFTPPGPANDGWGAFHSTTFTNRRGANQIVLGTFTLLDSRNEVLTSVGMDGVFMPLRYTAYESHYYQPMFITASDFAFATKVRWNLGCATR